MKPYRIFTARRSYASAVLGIVILSVRPSVCLSVTVLCDKTKQYTAYILITRKGNHSSFLTPTMASGRRSPLCEICAQSNPPRSKNADFDRFPLTTSQPQEIARKSSIMTNRKSTTGFRAIAIDGVRTLLLSPAKSGSKAIFKYFFSNRI